MSKIVDEKKAKQGRSGRPVLWVLIIGLILVMIVWYLVEWTVGREAPSVPDEPVQTAPAQSTAPAAPAAPAQQQ